MIVEKTKNMTFNSIVDHLEEIEKSEGVRAPTSPFNSIVDHPGLVMGLGVVTNCLVFQFYSRSSRDPRRPRTPSAV